jgi:hypothetical protein
MMAQTNFRASDMPGAAKAAAPAAPKAAKKAAAPAAKKAEAPVVEEVVVEAPAEESE